MRKTYVLDASAFVAYFQNHPGAAKVEQLLIEARSVEHPLLISAVNWAEVYAVLLRNLGEGFALKIKMMLPTLPVECVSLQPEMAILAAETRVRHQLPLLDSFAAALAVANHATLVTGDSDFQKVSRRISILWLRRP